MKRSNFKLFGLFIALFFGITILTGCSMLNAKVTMHIFGSEVDEVRVSYGSKYELPELKNRDLYLFEGWYDNQNYEGDTITEVIVGENTHVWAKWNLLTDVKSIKVKQNPTKVNYHAFETFNPDGLVVVAQCMNGSEFEISNNLLSFDKSVLEVSDEQVNITWENYSTRVDVTVEKASYDLKAIAFENRSVVYDGSKKSIEYTGTLPVGLHAQVIGEGVNAGDYEISLKFSVDDSLNYNVPEDLTATLTIEKATYDVSNIIFKNDSVVYDGNEHTLSYTGTLPEGVTAETDKFTNVGLHTVTLSFKHSNPNYNEIPDKTATLNIKKATYDVSNIVFENNSVVYDGQEHSISYKGTLPEGVIAETNKFKNAGTHTVTLSFKHSNPNYNEIPAKTATLEIKKATYDMSNAKWDYSVAFVYDGSKKTVLVTGLPKGVTVKKYNNASGTLAGEYTASVEFEYDTLNYNEVKVSDLVWEIKKATYDVSNIVFENNSVVYDGEEHSISYKGTLPEGVIAETNKFKNAGTHTVTLLFKHSNPNYEEIPAKTATLEIKKATYDMSNAKWDYSVAFVYDGDEKTVLVTGLPEGVTVKKYNNQSATLAGEYTASVEFEYDTLNYNEVKVSDLAWEIKKATFDITSVKWDYSLPFVYDGDEKNVLITGLPEGVTVKKYNNASATLAGEYTASVEFEYDTLNYNEVKVSDLAWEIKKITSISEANSIGNAKEKDKYTDEKYYVQGIITSITSTIFGNMYIEDIYGNNIYIYGLYTKDGKIRYDKMDNKPTVGTWIRVYGVIGKYNAPQLKNAWLIEQNYELSDDELAYVDLVNLEVQNVVQDNFKLDLVGTKNNSTITWKSSNQNVISIDANGNAIVDISKASIDEEVTLTATAMYGNGNGNGVSKKFSIFVIPSDCDLTIQQANFIGSKLESGDATNGKFFIEGTIKEISDSTYGNPYIEDSEGNTLYVYHLYSLDGSLKYDELNNKPIVGTKVRLYGTISKYNNTVQLKNAWLKMTDLEYSLTYESIENGTLSITDGKDTLVTGSKLKYNDLIKIMITPNLGYKVLSVNVNGKSISFNKSNNGNVEVNNYIFDDVDVTVELTLDSSLATKFEFGSNSSELKHSDGTSASAYSENNNNYTLSITNTVNFYKNAFDEKGNSCIKIGTSKKVGSFEFAVPDDIDEVVIYVAGYKTNNAAIKVNSSDAVIIKTYSTNGNYTPISISNVNGKTIKVETISNGYRAMIDRIEYYTLSDGAKVVKDNEALTINTDATTGITLPSTGTYGSTITWSSNNSAITIASDGSITINRPQVGSDDASVTLTATISCGETSKTKTFTVTVKAQNLSDEEIVALDKKAISFAKTDNLTESDTFNFPLKGPNGSTITWLNDNEDVFKISDKGVVTIVQDADNHTVQLTATIKYGNVSDHSIFFFKVLPSEKKIVAYDKEKLSLPTITDATASFDLLLKGEKNSTITWTSSNTSVISITDGVATITRPTTSTEVTLAAKITYGSAYDTREFTVPVNAATQGIITTTKWKLVTDVSQLSVGQKIVIVASNSNYALSTTQNSNNRGQTSITKNVSDETIIINSDVQIITLESGSKDGTLALKVGSGYLYAASTSSNHLKTETSLSNNSSWTISIDEDGIATITAQGTSTHNILKYNSSSKIFSCYLSGQDAVSIYVEKKATATESEIVEGDLASLKIASDATTGITLPSTGTNGSTITWSSNNSAIIIASDGSITITRPQAGSEDATVTLTATITYGSEYDTQEFTVTVKAENQSSTITSQLPETLSFTGVGNKADGDAYMKANYANWTITGKLGQTYAEYIGFGRSGDKVSAITSNSFTATSAFKVVAVIKGNGSNSVMTSTLTFELVDKDGNVVATGFANGSTTAAITPIHNTDTTYTISFTFAEGKSIADATNLKISFAKDIGNIGLKSVSYE